MGFSQRASVLILYAISALLGICAIMFTTNKVQIAVIILIVGIAVLVLDLNVFRSSKGARENSGVIENPEKYNETHGIETDEKEKEGKNSPSDTPSEAEDEAKSESPVSEE